MSPVHQDFWLHHRRLYLIGSRWAINTTSSIQFSLCCNHLFSKTGSAATDKYRLPLLKTEWLLMEKRQLCKKVVILRSVTSMYCAGHSYSYILLNSFHNQYRPKKYFYVLMVEVLWKTSATAEEEGGHQQLQIIAISFSQALRKINLPHPELSRMLLQWWLT